MQKIATTAASYLRRLEVKSLQRLLYEVESFEWVVNYCILILKCRMQENRRIRACLHGMGNPLLHSATSG